VSGRKRHLLVDTQGFVLKVVVSAADVQDRDGARLLAQAVRFYGPDVPRLSLVWADAGYAGQVVDDLRQQMGWTLEVVKRAQTQPRTAFAVQPHRWIVERTFSWFGGVRRLTKDYEYELESSEAMIYAAMIYAAMIYAAMIYAAMSHLLLRRLAQQTPAVSCPDG
jgi:putative transposase